LRILQHIERICQAIDIENFWEYNPFWLKEEKMISYSNFLESMVYITFPCKGEQQWFSFPIDFQHLNIQRTPFKGVLFLYTELTLRIECLLISSPVGALSKPALAKHCLTHGLLPNAKIERHSIVVNLVYTKSLLKVK
jgi:hypothetical protein